MRVHLCVTDVQVVRTTFQDNLMSDAPMKSVDSVHSVNDTALTTENNGTLMSPATESVPEGKMVSVPLLAHLTTQSMIRSTTLHPKTH